MTVSVQTPFNSFVANGVTTAFPFAYKIRSDVDIVVTLADASGNETAQTLGVHYTVSGAGTSSGTITFVAAPASGLTVKTRRATTLARSTDYQDNGDLLAAILNGDVDAVWLALQELVSGTQSPANSVHAPSGETLTQIAAAAQRRDRALVFDAVTGQPVMSPFTVTQLVSTIAAAFSGSAGPLDALSFVAAGVGAVSRSAQDKAREWVSVKDFGAKGDGVTDDTAAIQLAENVLVLVGATLGRYYNLRFPAGEYKCNMLTWNKLVSWVGDEVGNSRLVYNGVDNTAGTYIIGLAAGAGAVPWAGFYNLTLVGYDSTSTSNPCAAHCMLNLGTNLDWGFKLENIHAQCCFDDALQLRGTASVPVNLFLHRIRFDAVGGHAIYAGHNSSGNGAPLLLSDFTLDNNLSANMITKMTAQGRYDGSRWGKGLLRLEDGQGIGVTLRDCRIELNKKLISFGGGFSLVYSNNTVGGGRTTVTVRNITGQARNDQPVMFCKDVTGRTDFTSEGLQMANLAKAFETTTTDRDIVKNLVGRNASHSTATQQVGIGIGGHELEWRSNAPEQVAGVARYYKPTDITVNSAVGAGKAVMWGCKYPTSGFAAPNVNTVTAAAVVTSGSTVVSVPSSVITNLAPGLRITLVGAGVAAADLDVSVVSADEVANTITVSVAASTTVTPATIKNDSAEYAPLLYQQGVSADRGNANATVTLGVDAPTQYFNTALTANKVITLGTSASALGTVAQAWGRFRIARTAASTGAFTLDIAHNGGTKSLSTGQWADFEFNGSVWILTAAGSL